MTDPRTDGLVEPEDETIEAELVEGGTAMEATERVAVDVQVATARRFPRSVTSFREQIRTLATLDEKVAGSMFYVLPKKGQDGKRIEGPGVRLAELAIYSWRNVLVEASVVAIEDRRVICQATARDLERNVAVRIQVSRRIVDKYGKRYSEDVINSTVQAAISIAYRNATFKIIPFSLIRDAYEQAKRASLGEGKTTKDLRAAALAAAEERGIRERDVLRILGVAGLDDLGISELVALRGILTAIDEGETRLEEVLNPGRTGGESEAARDLGDRLKERAETAPPHPSPVETIGPPAGTIEAGLATLAAVGGTNEARGETMEEPGGTGEETAATSPAEAPPSPPAPPANAAERVERLFD